MTLFIPAFMLLIFISSLTSGCIFDEQWEVEIDHSGHWSGAVGGLGGSTSYEGWGDRTIYVNSDMVVAVIQKQESGSAALCVNIRNGGELIERGCTQTSYGSVSISAGGDGFDYIWLPYFLFFGFVMFIVSIMAKRSKPPQNISLSQNVPVYKSPIEKPPPLTKPPPETLGKSPPLYSKAQFELDGYEWLDYNDEKWHRPIGSRENWLFYEETLPEPEIEIEDTVSTQYSNAGTKRCKAIISYSLGIRCKNWFDGEGHYCSEHIDFGDDIPPELQ